MEHLPELLGERPAVRRMFARALTLRCPWCGSRRTFIRRWLGKHERCRTCGLRWRREEGFELGPLALNTIVTFGAVTAAMVIGLISTPPEGSAAPLFLICAVVASVVPLVIYPFTYLVWLAFDLAVHPPSDATDATEANGA
jgi:uncharacterized protein (DUF983 family)